MRKILSILMLLLAGFFGMASFMAFLIFLYDGALNWVKLDLSETQGMLINTLLCFVFFLQHSAMIRKPFRRSLSHFIPPPFSGSYLYFNVRSGLVGFCGILARVELYLV